MSKPKPRPASARALVRGLKAMKWSQADLARALNVFLQNVNNWTTRGVPEDRAEPIEVATGGAITRYQLLPEVFGTDARASDRAETS